MADARFSGSVLRDARERAGLTRSQLASLAGLRHGDRVASWERGADQPAAGKVPQLARALGIEAIALYDADPASPPLAVLRRIAGLTRTELARRSGLAYARCQRIENGGRRATEADMQTLATAIGVSIGVIRRALVEPSESASGSGGDEEGGRQRGAVSESSAVVPRARKGPNGLQDRDSDECRDRQHQASMGGVT